MDLLGPRPPDDNTVFYELYPANPAASEAELLALRSRCMQLAAPLLRGYIWQKEPFRLTPSTSAPQPWASSSSSRRAARAPGEGGRAAAACLWGSTCWGENVEDEWLVVHLLLDMTARVQHLTARAWDNDGEFLLIEAAYALPRWLKPESARNRVWLRGGQLHIVPLPSAAHPTLPPAPTAAQALQILSSGAVQTAAPKVHAAIAARLEGYPGKALELGRHVSKATLPARLAAALRACPQLVSSAVEAFYFRDGDDMKAAARMKHFPPSEPRATVLMATNRCQYAQLAQQPFAPPRGWRLPPPNHPDLPPAERGLKVTAGFEILVARAAQLSALKGGSRPAAAGGSSGADAASSSSSGQQGADAPQPPREPFPTETQLLAHPSWGAYKDSLERLGYFQGNIPGSSKHTALLEAAKADFVSSPTFERGIAEALGPAELLQQVLEQVGSGEGLRAVEEALGPEDSDSWMESQGAAVEAELAKREKELQGLAGRGRKGKGASGGGAGGARGPGGQGAGLGGAQAAAAVDAAEVAARIRSFVDAMSGLEGAELPDSGKEVALDAAAFTRELEQALGMPFGKEGGMGLGGGQQQQEEGEEGEEWTSTDEGSSFFSDDGQGSGGEDEDEGEQLQGDGQEEGEWAHAYAPALSVDVGARGSSQGVGSAAGCGPHRPPLPPRLQQLQDAWEACTATDSDDDAQGSTSGSDALSIGGHTDDSAGGEGEEGFMQAYAAVLEAQLQGTTLQDSFERSAGGSASAGAGAGGPEPQQRGGGGAGQARAARSSGAAGAELGVQPLQPVDLDMNLVRNLVRSVASQQGMAGPGTNLAGLLGLDLPHGIEDPE